MPNSILINHQQTYQQHPQEIKALRHQKRRQSRFMSRPFKPKIVRDFLKACSKCFILYLYVSCHCLLCQKIFPFWVTSISSPAIFFSRFLAAYWCEIQHCGAKGLVILMSWTAMWCRPVTENHLADGQGLITWEDPGLWFVDIYGRYWNIIRSYIITLHCT